MEILQTKGMGWVRDLPDIRDKKWKLPIRLTTVPNLVDLRPSMPPIYDQDGLGSCTANAIGAAVEYEQTRQGLPTIIPSRLFIYYNERVLEGDVETDGGAMIRTGIKTLNQFGVCDETFWPYDVGKFATKPTDLCFQKAIHHRAVQYQSVNQTLLDIQSVLATGYPVVFGFSVYESFEGPDVAKTGVVPMPSANENLLGGHAVLIVGYDDSKKALIVRNSWGPSWGDNGYFYMPYEYATNQDLADDFWTVQLIQNDPDSLKRKESWLQKIEDPIRKLI